MSRARTGSAGRRARLRTHTSQAADEVLLVLQRQRSDGAELLTLRVPLAEFDSVLAYAGAGLNRTVYFAETSAGETFTTGHGRHRSLGAAAELGAEWRVSERMALSADLRWIDLADDASLLRSGDSLVAADPVVAGSIAGLAIPLRGSPHPLSCPLRDANGARVQ